MCLIVHGMHQNRQDLLLQLTGLRFYVNRKFMQFVKALFDTSDRTLILGIRSKGPGKRRNNEAGP
jgi:hypothetical protein